MDNYVGNVYKGHFLYLSFNANFIKNSLQNKDILLKDTKNSYFVSRETYISCYTCNKHINMPKIFTSKTQKLGEIGENIASRFLVKQGFIIQERNYTQRWGEIDIIASKENKIYFVEVKSVSRQNLKDVPRETLDDYRPEDNMHPWKMKRMAKTIQTYMMSNKVPEYMDWQVDLIVIFIDLNNKKAKIKVISDLIL